MLQIKIVDVLVSGSEPHEITGVQDSFGKTYHVFAHAYRIGSVAEVTLTHVEKIGGRSITTTAMGKDSSTIRYRILGVAELSEVRRLANLDQRDAGKPLKEGNWYEVLTD